MSDRADFDEARRRLFGANPAAYGDGRPGYPAGLYDHLADRCGLGPGRRVLEIGPGAGQATDALVGRCAGLTVVEPATSFCEALRERFGRDGVDVIEGDFEDVELAEHSFDLVVAATSFHWVEPGAGLSRVAELLRPGGSVALWWTHYGDATRADPFRAALQPLLRRHAPQFADEVDGGVAIGAHPYALDARSRLGEIDAVGRFQPAERIEFPWAQTQTAEQVRRFFASFSHWMALEEPGRSALLDDVERLVADEFGGVVDRPFVTALYWSRLAAG